MIAIYLHCYRMLRFPDDETHFQRFKEMLLKTWYELGEGGTLLGGSIV